MKFLALDEELHENSVPERKSFRFAWSGLKSECIKYGGDHLSKPVPPSRKTNRFLFKSFILFFHSIAHLKISLQNFMLYYGIRVGFIENSCRTHATSTTSAHLTGLHECIMGISPLQSTFVLHVSYSSRNPSYLEYTIFSSRTSPDVPGPLHRYRQSRNQTSSATGISSILAPSNTQPRRCVSGGIYVLPSQHPRRLHCRPATYLKRSNHRSPSIH